MEHHLVTGGAGYFGETVVRNLLARDKKVRVLDLNPLQLEEGAPPVENFLGDIRDPDRVKAACKGITHIHHNVAQVPIAKNKELFWSVNSGGTKNILEAAQAMQVQKLVYTSSSAVFGAPKHNPVVENTPPHPCEDYGQAKLAGETLCHAYTARGLDVSIIRPRTIIGRGRLGIFQILFEWVYQGQNIPVLGNGDNIYQFIHADDLAEICVRAAFEEGAQTYNAGTSVFGTMRETLEALCQHAATGSKVASLPRVPLELAIHLSGWLGISPLGPYHAIMYGRSLYFDASKVKQRLGYEPKHSNIDAICASYDWYVQHRDTVLAAKNQSAHKSALKQGVLKLVKYLI